MNKMYKYLKEHAYVSENKHSNYQFELTEERAECIANKHNNIIKDLEEENKQLKNNWNKLKEYLEKSWAESQDIWFVKIINQIQELELESDIHE